MTDPRHIDYPPNSVLRVYYCDCGGKLLPGSVARQTCPPQYQHNCCLCEKEYWLKTLSGSVFYRDIPNEIEAKK